MLRDEVLILLKNSVPNNCGAWCCSHQFRFAYFRIAVPKFVFESLSVLVGR